MLSPAAVVSMESMRAIFETAEKNALATVIVYSDAFAEYLEAVIDRRTGSSIGN